MQYTHKKTSLGRARIIYIALMLLGIFLTSLKLENWARFAFTTIGIFSIVASAFLILKYELTEYTVIVNAKEDNIDFFINKVVGKRGAYDCYFKMSCGEEALKLERGTKEELKKKYSKILFHTYCHNIVSQDKYAIVFKNDDQYECVICELNDTMLSYIESSISIAKNAWATRSPDNE